MKDFLNFVKTAIGLVLILWILFFFFIGIKMAPNDDMYPRISAGDIVLYYKITSVINTQDVVVLKKNGTEYLGRVIARNGDTVDITDEENLIINGNLVIETNIFYPTPRYEGFTDYPVKLGPDEYFILADKREGGEDSRYYGPVNKKEIKGTVVGQYRRNGM